MRTWLCLAVLLIAGCSEAPALEETDDLPPVTTGRDTGAIQGVVLDPSIRPIPGATVGLQTTQESAVADAGGGFGFSQLAPGTYFLSASAPGHIAATQSVEVKAGEVTKTKMLLQVDARPTPYNVTLQHKGFVGLWAPGPSYVINLVYPHETVCDCETRFEPGSNIHAFVFEAVWDASVEVPTMDQMSWELDSYIGDSLDQQEGEYAASPVHAVLGRSLYSDQADNWLARMTPGIAAGIYIQQDYDMFVTVFYNADPPPGWSLVGQG